MKKNQIFFIEYQKTTGNRFSSSFHQNPGQNPGKILILRISFQRFVFLKEKDPIFRFWNSLYPPGKVHFIFEKLFSVFCFGKQASCFALARQCGLCFLWRISSFLFLFNCSSSRWIGRNQAAGKRFTLYLPVILDSGPICRSKLLFCITLCHRTHPFSLKINPEIMYHPALPDAPPEINSSSFSVSVKNRRYRILTSGFRVPVGFFFFLLSIFNSGYIITGVCGAVKRFF